jgi:hypothetical protein
MKCDILPLVGFHRLDANCTMPRSPKPLTDDEMTRSLKAAREFAGEEQEPLTPEEEAVMKEVRASKGRPTKKEIAALAKRIARSAR